MSGLQSGSTTNIDLLRTAFSNNLGSSKILSNTYETLLKNSSYANQLYNKYLEENAILQNNSQGNSDDIFTNDRKTYYENQGIDSLKWWHNLFFSLYIVLVISYVLFFFISSSSFSILMRFFIFIFLVVYPFVSPFILKILIGFFYRVASFFPKNAYLNG
jgi:hypothetical protein